MNEDDFARRLSRHLDEAAAHLDVEVAAALRERRRRLGASQVVALGGGMAGLGLARHFLPAGAVLGLLLALMWWAGQRPAAEDAAQMDLLLLTDDLPPHAYTDRDFPKWHPLPGLCRS